MGVDGPPGCVPGVGVHDLPGCRSHTREAGLTRGGTRLEAGAEIDTPRHRRRRRPGTPARPARTAPPQGTVGPGRTRA
eukprot:405608-Pyramimonas_sp.AAC.1